MDKVLGAAIIMTLLVAAFITVGSLPGPSTAGTQQTENRLVPMSQIVSGGPLPDGIPSIDHPKFTSAANATFLSDSYDVVIGVDYNGDARAYPLQILVWHEIVNDVIGGLPLAITYCPLCYSTAAFIRVVNNVTVTFGTSGKLYNNNLVMYDRLTKSLWSQIWGQSIAGQLTGYTLQRIPVDVLSWGEWKKLHPNTVVLSKQTGFNRPYGDDPYGGYNMSDEIFFPLSHFDRRLSPKTVVWGLTVEGQAKAYPLQNLTTLTKDSLGGKNVLVWKFSSDVRFFDPVVRGILLNFEDANGTIVDLETHSTWNYEGVATSGLLSGLNMTRYVAETIYWFAWAAFYPNTTLYSPQTHG